MIIYSEEFESRGKKYVKDMLMDLKTVIDQLPKNNKIIFRTLVKILSEVSYLLFIIN